MHDQRTFSALLCGGHASGLACKKGSLAAQRHHQMADGIEQVRRGRDVEQLGQLWPELHDTIIFDDATQTHADIRRRRRVTGSEA